MITNKNILFPYYSGNIRFVKVMGHTTLDRFIQAHVNPTPRTRRIIDEVKACTDSKKKRLLKHDLYSFTPNVYINNGDKRKIDNIVDYTGLMQLDFDKIEDAVMSIEIKNWVFEQPECVVSYLSPSGGVKALIKINKSRNLEHFKAIHKAVTQKYEATGYFDEATKNVVLPLFISYDEYLLCKDYSQATCWNDEDWSETEHVALNNEPPPNFNDSDFNLEKTIKILRNKIESINDNGHPQVRSAALILGSRAGAGYIDILTARNEIERCIRNNKYLNKGVSGYISTALWGVSEGYKNPKFY